MTSSPSNVSVGTVGFDGARERTFAKLDAVEVQDTFRGTPGAKLLSRLRNQAPDRFSFVLQAPQVLSQPDSARGKRPSLPYLPSGTSWPSAPFDTGPAGRAAWAWIREVAERLSAKAVIFQTSARFRPTAPNRRRMRQFFDAIGASPGPHLLWEARGLWSTEEHQSLCRDLDILPVLDPLVETVVPGQMAYLRVVGRSRSIHGLSADDLDTLADARNRLAWGLIMLSTPRPFRDALALKQLSPER